MTTKARARSRKRIKGKLAGRTVTTYKRKKVSPEYAECAKIAATLRADASLFNDVYIPHLNNTARTQIYYGGSGSGKSVFLAQRAIIDVLEGGRNYLCIRAVRGTMRESVYAELVAAIDSLGVGDRFKATVSPLQITCTNGYQILFRGLDNVEKVKSIRPIIGSITNIWVEEATETRPGDINQLYKRQRGGDESTPKVLTLSFNPILQSHWIYKKHFEPVVWHGDKTEHTSDDLTILKTWYIHNRFLTESDVYDLENEGDQYYRDVYTFGNWGVLGNVIFKNWRVDDLSDMGDQWTNRRHGLDFGYANDPAAYIGTHYDKTRKRIYVYDTRGGTGLLNTDLATLIDDAIGRDRVLCDSAEPKSIKELRTLGINAYGAKKGRDSVTHGIQWLMQNEIIIDSSCVELINELQQYHWKERGGVVVSPAVPVDKHNHWIDALRYAYADDMTRGGRRAVIG